MRWLDKKYPGYILSISSPYTYLLKNISFVSITGDMHADRNPDQNSVIPTLKELTAPPDGRASLREFLLTSAILATIIPGLYKWVSSPEALQASDTLKQPNIIRGIASRDPQTKLIVSEARKILRKQSTFDATVDSYYRYLGDASLYAFSIYCAVKLWPRRRQTEQEFQDAKVDQFSEKYILPPLEERTINRIMDFYGIDPDKREDITDISKYNLREHAAKIAKHGKISEFEYCLFLHSINETMKSGSTSQAIAPGYIQKVIAAFEYDGLFPDIREKLTAASSEIQINEDTTATDYYGMACSMAKLHNEATDLIRNLEKDPPTEGFIQGALITTMVEEKKDSLESSKKRLEEMAGNLFSLTEEERLELLEIRKAILLCTDKGKATLELEGKPAAVNAQA